MKLSKTLFAGVLMMATAFAQAQTADEIVDKHIAAIGGKETITKIKSMVTEGELTVQGMTLPSKNIIVFGKGARNEADFQGQQIIECVSPTGGWTINPFQGMTDPQPLPEDRVKAGQSAFDQGSRLFNYKEKGHSIELAGTENVDGVNAHKLKVKDKDGSVYTYFINPTNFYIVRQDESRNVNGQEMQVTTTFSNFKKTDVGLVIPFTTNINVGVEIVSNITKVEFNKEVDPKIFEMPK